MKTGNKNWIGKEMNKELIEAIKALKEILGPNGEYSIHRSDGEPMDLPSVMRVGSIFEKIDRAVDYFEQTDELEKNKTR